MSDTESNRPKAPIKEQRWSELKTSLDPLELTGDLESFTKIHNYYLGYLYRKFPNLRRDDIEDIIQNALFSVISTKSNIIYYPAYLRQAMIHAAIEQQRSTLRYRSYVDIDTFEETIADAANVESEATNTVMFQQALDRMLTDEERFVVLLRVQGATWEEISEVATRKMDYRYVFKKATAKLRAYFKRNGIVSL